MKKQYILQKYVMADSAADALKKGQKMPTHEVYVHTQWFDKVAGYEFVSNAKKGMGFKKPSE